MTTAAADPTEVGVKLERSIDWRPAFDRRAPEPAKNYGIHGVECHWTVKGPKGGIIWTIFTNWQLPHVTKESIGKTVRGPTDALDLKVRFLPTGAGIEYHGLRPRYEGQSPREGCLLVPGGVCYSDISYTAGDELLEVLIAQGSEAVWKNLEERYADLPEPEALA